MFKLTYLHENKGKSLQVGEQMKEITKEENIKGLRHLVNKTSYLKYAMS